MQLEGLHTVECVDALDNRPLRQGDIFSWLPDHQVSPWKLHGIVVTADCDLARGKSHGTVSYLPLLRLIDYIWCFWLPIKFKPVRDAAAKKMGERLSKIVQNKTGHETQPMAQSSVIYWIERTINDDIARELGLADNGQIKMLAAECDKIRKLTCLLSAKEPDIQLLTECYSFKSPAAPEPAAKLREEIRSYVSALPGDVFWLSALLTSTEGPYVAMLRYISQCSIEEVAVDTRQLEQNEPRAKRTARLTLPYLHAMTQSLGRVFSDIGLPDSYSANRATCADSLGIV